MIDLELLLEQTESYLISLFSEVSSIPYDDLDPHAPFSEMGIDSFYVLKIVKKLEDDFGRLPKTLLFEKFNIGDLAVYFVAEHKAVILDKFQECNAEETYTKGTLNSEQPIKNANQSNFAMKQVLDKPTLILEEKLHLYSDLKETIEGIYRQFKNESSVSRGTRNIAPNLFIGSDKRAFFNYARSKNLILAYGYTGPDECFPQLAEEIHHYCNEKQFHLNILVDFEITSVGEHAFYSTPFGTVQRVLNLQDFSLEGKKMRRLRYQFSRFEKEGECRTEEYQCGSSSDIDKNIVHIIDQWCEGKSKVNPLVFIVRNEILSGTFSSEHRIFLTYIDSVLQNVIFISELSPEDNGYLMDLEFYPSTMPLGGLEFAIVRIIEKISAEGFNMLSLGATFGPKIALNSNADPDVDIYLDELREQGIFNDSGNFQFKNKFRPENRSIYLCRAINEQNADNVIDVIMMIADPSKMQTVDEENHTFFTNFKSEVATTGLQGRQTVTSRDSDLGDTLVSRNQDSETANEFAGEEWEHKELVEFSYNPGLIPDDLVNIDLKTDSWAKLTLPAIEKQMHVLYSNLQQPANLVESLREIFPFSYFTLTNSGRDAEHMLCKAWENGEIVIQNILFPTGISSQIDNGFDPIELPHPAVFDVVANSESKGGLNWDALVELVESPLSQSKIAFVWVELANNAVGGQAVTIEHLQRLKSLLSGYDIPLVFDATRILENSYLLIKNAKSGSLADIWCVVREILSYADVVTASLAKDFCLTKGGVIATSNKNLHSKIQKVTLEGSYVGLDLVDKKLIALALKNKNLIANLTLERVNSVEFLWNEFYKKGVPVIHPVGGHCVLIDVKQIDEFKLFSNPAASFVAWVYQESGIRLSIHNVGMQRNTSLNELVRLAVPVGMGMDMLKQVVRDVTRILDNKVNIPEIVIDRNSANPFVGIDLKYRLVRRHNLQHKSVLRDALRQSPAANLINDIQPISRQRPLHRPSLEDNKGTSISASQVFDIAVVGMAGRYPQAKNMDELWNNLVNAKDCITDIPPDRYNKRVRNTEDEYYRGGFIDDIDKFDSMFFNISPREAEMLDPQERIFMEVAWETIEDAGYYPENIVQENADRNVGVFVGAVWTMYQLLGVEERLAGNKVSPNSFLWSIANRISYWMNFSGPSLTIDTACSSSLTALYLACEAIYKGECSAALVGGVNLDLHQTKININTAGGALSKDGVCRSFGQGANGYVAGEGVGAIFIKPLDQAVRDRDNIHGIVKSVVVNHGGKTAGYTVPSPQAQAKLIASALERANIDARSIGYIEAHGTGTELGDPIEVNGLNEAFKKYQVASQTCAIGSVKSNIGHLEAAAGVVSISKVLLQMRHEKLVPSLHSTHLNEFIDFTDSPFYVEQEVEPWVGKVIDGVQHPIRAGVSSFGAGGSNAHVILEKYIPSIVADLNESATIDGGMFIFPLSARNEKQLREYAVRLQTHLRNTEAESCQDFRIRIENIAYTLQVGRKSFDCRLAIIASTTEQLLNLLDKYIHGKEHAGILVGNSKATSNLTNLLNRKEKAELIRMLSERRDPFKLAQLWIDGLLTDWQGKLQEGYGKKISLPTYPFSDKRHWVAERSNTNRICLSGSRPLHPLIDLNESTFERQVFKKVFTENDFFIHDHFVSGIATLPGVAYLELAKKAGELATGRRVNKVKNMLWLSPLTVGRQASTDAWIELMPTNEQVRFEVFGKNQHGDKQLYASGKLSFSDDVDSGSREEYLNFESIKSRCSKIAEGDELYPMFDSLGLSLGPSFQVLENVFRSETEILGSLKVPQNRLDNFSDFSLHPSLIDGALQAGMGAKVKASSGEMYVPYSIGEVEVLAPLTPHCFSYIQEINDSNSRVSKANVHIVDETGRVLVRIKDSIGIPLHEVHEKTDPLPISKEFSTLYYSSEWETQELIAGDQNSTNKEDVILFFDSNLVPRQDIESVSESNTSSPRIIQIKSGDSFSILSENIYSISQSRAEDYRQLFSSICDDNRTIKYIVFDGSMLLKSSAPEDISNGVCSFLYLCQSLIERKIPYRVPIVYFYINKDGSPQPHHEGVAGFAKTLHAEHPKLICKIVEIIQENSDADITLWDYLASEASAVWEDVVTVRYDNQQRYIKAIKHLDIVNRGNSEPTYNSDLLTIPDDGALLKEKGVYLITGGVGGLGFIFSRYLAEKYKAKLVLVGRSVLSPESAIKLDTLTSLGAEVLYISADISVGDDVKRVIEAAKTRFTQINGVVHGAGVLRDAYVRNKTSDEVRAVLAPKVQGTINLDEATKTERLDFFVLFSSLAAVGGNAGQSDYAFANRYMDAFAGLREMWKMRGERFGKTISLNWSLWADGGMRLDEQTELFFSKNLGIKPLDTQVGIQAFESALNIPNYHLVVVEGEQEKFEHAWGLRKKVEAKKTAPHNATSAAATTNKIYYNEVDDLLLNRAQETLAQMVANFLKLEITEIDRDAILLNLGFDSIGLATFANLINETYKLDITPVLFFEYPSINEIAKHLASDFSDQMAQKYRVVKHLNSDVLEENSNVDNSPPGNRIEFKKNWSPDVAKLSSLIPQPAEIKLNRRFEDMPIAIVGMSGVMPLSDNLDIFWNNLINERNLISVIPEDRWDWQEYFGDPSKEVNKSNSKWGGFMNSVDKFDPLFFGISPREAEWMDPQQRIFLETVWKTIEDAGQKPSDLSGTKTGLFVGVATNDYIDVINKNGIGIDAYTSTGNSHSVLVNRVSFLLNLRGPSAPIDTACSSSLVALHRAVESIHTGSSDMAIVGGVQVMASPAAYISFGMAGMLSSDGKCKTFDKSANGYVRGEGVGAILIKPLSKAQTDGNHIYALIKATAENHGGRVTTLTAPNPTAQSELLIEAYKTANIDPTTVGYIECHGTGTSIGDPIEIQALKKSFSELHKVYGKSKAAKPYCGLSSVKTNIGHLETAAGIAGIVKVLLSIKHKKIPASIHFEEINPYIDLTDSPFYIVNKTQPWPSIPGDDGKALPRRAGVSSFGFGGANVHIVLEEYLVMEEITHETESAPVVVVLSAKNTNRLKDYARILYERLESEEIDLASLAYTLQVGREEMPERLAIVASSMTDLKNVLQNFLQGSGQSQNLYQENITKLKEKAPDDDGNLKLSSLDITDLASAGDYHKLAKHWVSGGQIDWYSLYNGARLKRVPLPGYPFARDRYWIKTAEGHSHNIPATKSNLKESYLHSLIHKNTSTIKQQKFSSIFTGKEFYFVDHAIKGKKVLPTFAYFEMVRVAAELSGERPVRGIKDIVWFEHMVVDSKPEMISIALTIQNDKPVFSVATNGDTGESTHFSGEAVYDPPFTEAALNLELIKERCQEIVLEGTDLYSIMERTDLLLGKTLRVVSKVYATSDEALAMLYIPDGLKASLDDFFINPALLTGAFHAVIAGLLKKNKWEVPLGLPIAAKAAVFNHSLDEIYFAYATWVQHGPRQYQDLLHVDISLLSREGKILLQIKDLRVRPLTGEQINVIKMEQRPLREIMYYRNVWSKAPFHSSQGKDAFPKHLIVFDEKRDLSNCLCDLYRARSQEVPLITLVYSGLTYQSVGKDTYEINPDCSTDYRMLLESLSEKKLPLTHIIYRWQLPDIQEKSDSESNFYRGIYSFFYLAQALIELVRAHSEFQKIELLHFYSVRSDDPKPLQSALSGFSKSLILENPKLIFKHISLLEDGVSVTAENSALGSEKLETDNVRLANIVLNELQASDVKHLEMRYRGEIRLAKQLDEIKLSAPNLLNLKHKGVYLITGGLGGLGQIFAGYLADKFNAHLGLTGRSELTKSDKNKLNGLISLGAEVEYFQCDVSNAVEVQQLIDRVKARFGTINGIFHTAGTVRDSLISNKTVDDIAAVVSAKVHGTLNLDRFTRNENLDFYVLFSSISAVTGNAGQSDYAYANSFMDNFVDYRQALEAKGSRFGQTISINWSLWREGKMTIPAEMEVLLRRNTGIEVIEKETGLACFETILASNLQQVLVIDGDRQKVKKSFGLGDVDNNTEKTTTKTVGSPAESRYENDQKRKKVINELDLLFDRDLMNIVISTLGIDEQQFARDEEMSEFGFDSINVARFVTELSNKYAQDIAPALFYEYSTFNKLKMFLMNEYEEELSSYYSENLQSIDVKNVVRSTVNNTGFSSEDAIGSKITEAGWWDYPTQDYRKSLSPNHNHDSIAIVGVSGVFPHSPDIKLFWANLVAEKDLVSEVPLERWDWKLYDGDPSQETNKTNSRWGGFISDVDKFDASFFDISADEADLMDPQQRLFLETVWKAIEDSGHSPTELAGTKTGLFVGVGSNDYLDVIRDNDSDISIYTSTGNTHVMLANRISHLLDIRGPSEPINSACSSSLVAVHRAVESITNGNCDMAIAGGVNVLLSPALYLSLGHAGVLSNSGRCKSFDKNADGYVRGEGSGAVFLKRLKQALIDRDPVYGIIAASGINHGGHSTSLTSPNPKAQTDLIIDTYKKANINPLSIGFIETHGTGTYLGDSIEISSLKNAFKILTKDQDKNSLPKTYCGIGAVKSNIGHLEAAAGIASLIKVLLAIRHKTIPGTVHFNELSPLIKLENSPFYVVNKTQAWQRLKDKHCNDLPLKAGVSSFGFGGVNAHIVVQEYIGEPEYEMGDAEGKDFIIPLSAKTDAQLKNKVNELLAFIQNGIKKTENGELLSNEKEMLISMAYTLQIGRDAMMHRVGFVVDSMEQLAEKLKRYLQDEAYIMGVCHGAVGEAPEGIELISNDADIKETVIRKLIEQKKWIALLNLWVKGMPIDWNCLYGKNKPKRMGLPSYPFDKKRHWVAENTEGSHAGFLNSSISVRNPIRVGRISVENSLSQDNIIKSIQTKLADNTEINEAIVLPVNRTDFLGYVTTKDVFGERISEMPNEELARFLESSLLPFILPFSVSLKVILLEEFPLLQNGHVDKNALRAIAGQPQIKSRIPKTQTETKLAYIWKELLGVGIEQIQKDSDFFKLGGHSSAAVEMISRVGEVFSIELELLHLFECSTLSNLSQQIDSKMLTLEC